MASFSANVPYVDDCGRNTVNTMFKQHRTKHEIAFENPPLQVLSRWNFSGYEIRHSYINNSATTTCDHDFKEDLSSIILSLNFEILINCFCIF